MVALCILREIGPVIVGLIMARNVGSGIGAELASMRVTEQLDAMEVSGTNPMSFVVLTRVLAVPLMLPLLFIFADTHALAGDFLKPVDITDKVNEGEGNPGRILNDSSIAIKMDNSMDTFQAITQNLKELTHQLNMRDSDQGRFINEDQFTSQLDLILLKFDSIACNVELASKDLAQTTVQLSMASQAVISGDGLVNKLIYDSTFADSIAITIDHLNQTLTGIEVVVKLLKM